MPPTRGPSSEATPNMHDIRPIYIGRCLSGMICVTTARDPPKMPADPAPAMARPNIRIYEFGAAAQAMEPPSKIATASI
jgi:hypothetical protein